MKTHHHFLWLLFFGIPQIWIVGVYLWAKKTPFVFWDLLKDGNLFFFSTAFAATAFVTHFKVFKKTGKDEFLVGVFFVAFVFFASLIGFLSAIDIIPNPTSGCHFSISFQHSAQYTIQFSAFGAAIWYGILVERRLKISKAK